jgi:hypothetical protein
MNWCPNCPPWTFLYLVPYPQLHTKRGLLFARVCPECEYDDTLERFASRPEYSYTAWAYPGLGYRTDSPSAVSEGVNND